MNYEPMIRARKALSGLWKGAWLKGRCWGPKREDNPYGATNITLAIGKELVSISQKGNKLIIHEFSKTNNTSLGRKIREIFKKEELIFD